MPDLKWKVSCWLLVRRQRLPGSFLEYVSHRQRFGLPFVEFLGVFRFSLAGFELVWHRNVRVVLFVFVAQRGVISPDPLEEVSLLVPALKIQN